MTWLLFIFMAGLSYLLSVIIIFIALHRNILWFYHSYLCCVWSKRDALLSKKGIPCCGFMLLMGQPAQES